MLQSKHSLETKAVRCLLRGRSGKAWASAMLRPRHSLENHGLATLFAEPSAEIEGVGDAAVEVFN